MKHTKLQWILLSALALLTIVFRLPFRGHQFLLDGFTQHNLAQAILDNSFIPWVYHPASIIGYYPMSFPVGNPVFLAVSSLITGLSLEGTILALGVGLGILGVLGLYVLLRTWTSFEFAYFASVLYAISAEMVWSTSDNASSRILLVIFAPIILWSFVKIYEGPRRLAHSVLLFVLLAISPVIHRTSQVLVVFIAAFVLTIIYLHRKEIWHYLVNTRIGHKYLYQRHRARPANILLDFIVVLIISFSVLYMKNPVLLFLGIAIPLFLVVIPGLFSKRVVWWSRYPIIKSISLLAILTILKIIDLMLRDRLLPNITKVDQAITVWKFAVVGIFTLGLFLTYLYVKKAKPQYLTVEHWKNQFMMRRSDLDLYFSLALFIFFVHSFFGQFFGGLGSNADLGDFTESRIFKGTGPAILFINLVINYTTTINLLFIFCFVGVIYLVLRKNKKFQEFLLLLIFILLSKYMIDKIYMKTFLIPILCFLSALGVRMIISAFSRTKLKKIVPYIWAVLIIVTILFANISVHRSFFIDKKPPSHLQDYDETFASAEWASTNGLSGSALSDYNPTAIIFQSVSDIPFPPHNVYLNVKPEEFKTKVMKWPDLKERLLGGELRDIWIAIDWIKPGTYYTGRHGIHVYSNPYTDPLSQNMMSAYHENYYVQTQIYKKSTLLNSLEPFANRIYVNNLIDIYDIQRGRSI